MVYTSQIKENIENYCGGLSPSAEYVIDKAIDLWIGEEFDAEEFASDCCNRIYGGYSLNMDEQRIEDAVAEYSGETVEED